MARQCYYWPKMRTDIINHVAQCLLCAQTKGSTTTSSILEYPTPDGPFDTVAIDLFKLPRSHQGSTYALVCVDRFSRFVVLAPLPNKSATAVAHALVSSLLCSYTTPVLLCDNGTKFKNDVLYHICQQYHIKQTFITAHHPASNGLAERTNRKVLEILRHVAGQLHESWEDWLPHVAASINGSIISSMGKTPHYIVFGLEKRFPYDLLVSPHKPVYSEDYSQSQLKELRIIHDEVRKSLQASCAEMLAHQHSKATAITIAVDDTVFKAAPERQVRLTPKFSGPFMVKECLHNNKFWIFDPSFNASKVVHADRLKRADVLIPSFSDFPYHLRSRSSS